jgi:hypothetical protein
MMQMIDSFLETHEQIARDHDRKTEISDGRQDEG